MEFNYGKERRRLENEWKKHRVEYAEADWAEEAIEELYQFDLHTLNRERAYRNNTMLVDGTLSSGADAEESRNPLAKECYEALSVQLGEICTWGRYDWIEDLETPELAAVIKSLSQTDIEILTYMVVDGFKRTEVADEMSISRAAVTKRINRIKKKIS